MAYTRQTFPKFQNSALTREDKDVKDDVLAPSKKRNNNICIG